MATQKSNLTDTYEDISGKELMLVWLKMRVMSWSTCIVFCILGYWILTQKEHTWFQPDVARDLAIALLVAGLVGIGLDFIAYGAGRAKAEVIAETRAKQVAQVTKYIKSLHNTQDELLQLVDILYSEKEFKRLRHGLSETIRCVEKIRSMKSDDDETTVARDIDPFIDFLGWSMERNVSKVVQEKIKCLTVLHRKRSNDTAHYDIPDRFEVNRRLLAAQMSTLDSGDQYDSLANWRLYEHAAEEADFYEQMTIEALKRGASIRRIFNVCKVQDKHRERVREIVQRQIDTFKNKGDFQIRFLTCEVLANACAGNALIEKATKEIYVPTVGNLDATFFGVFRRRDLDVMLYRTESGQDREIVESVAIWGETSTTQEPYVRLFDLLWDVAATKSPFKDLPRGRVNMRVREGTAGITKIPVNRPLSNDTLPPSSETD
ncbi:hypothetical protein [Caballeronia grimmiae]|uniref:hypothetical protein n=1 Tax=Caballeronia grimmiae TaxID=1071679 RepID=UPI0038B8AF82